MTLNEIKAQLKGLSADDKEALKSFLESEVAATDDKPADDKASDAEPAPAESEKPAEDKTDKESGEETAPEAETTQEETATPETPAETTPDKPVDEPQEKADVEKAAAPEQEPAAEMQQKPEDAADTQPAMAETPEQAPETTQPDAEQTSSPSEDEIPVMQRVTPAMADEQGDENLLTADTGETLPVDYEQIVDGQNAKIAALEAEIKSLKTENATLKSKVDGAFGYSAKPTTPARVNPLYDDCDGIVMHR